MKERYYTTKKLLLLAMSLFYILAGINHFAHPLFYKKIMPSYIPWHIQLIYASGVMEILLGILLIPLITRRIAAWGIIILLIVIFPANIHMTLNYWRENKPGLWITILRLPFQIALIWWAYIFTRRE